MALSLKRRQELAAMMLPTDDVMQKRVRAFLLQSGLNQSELAEQVGFSHTAIGLFLNNRYDQHHPAAANTANLKAALKAYMDLHDVQNDVKLLGEHYLSTDFLRLREAALSAMRQPELYVVDGPPGTQKSRSLLHIQREIQEAGLGRVVYVYSRVEHTKQSFLQELCRAAGVPNRGGVDALLHKLQFFLSRGRVLFLIDEAQHLSMSALEVLRQLLDLPPYFSAIVAGSHEFSERIQHWQMEQWRRRVLENFTFTGPSKHEARTILAKQLGVADRTEADAIIADCMATATRHDGTRRRRYEYVSAGLLFGFIQGAKGDFSDSLNVAETQFAAPMTEAVQ